MKGLTLLELQITIVLSAILLAIAVPNFLQSKPKTLIDNATHRLWQSLNLARTQAIASGFPVTICPSSDGNTCQGLWSEGFIIFIDKLGNRHRENEDLILHVHQGEPSQYSLEWHGFPKNTQTLQYTPDGLPNEQNGRFILVSDTGLPVMTHNLVISKSGRLRKEVTY